jgi:hypothetical protein
MPTVGFPAPAVMSMAPIQNNQEERACALPSVAGGTLGRRYVDMGQHPL